MRFDEAIEDFLFHCSVERRLSTNTVQAYRGDLRHFSAFVRPDQAGNPTSVASLKRYLAYMLGDAGLSVATARRRVACLQGFFAFASARHGIRNPFLDWSPSLKRPKRLPRAVSHGDVRSLVDGAGDLTRIDVDTVFAVLVISATGVRVSELCAIRVIDVSMDGSSVQVMGKGARDRIVYVSDERLRRDFVDRRRRRMAEEGETAPLLINSRGTRLQPPTLRRRLHSLSRRTGISRVITPHMLRHTAATLLLESGTDIRFVQRLLGHASIATTEIYTQVNDVALKRAIFQANTLRLISDTT